jgi:hypothetical protein
LHEFACIRLIVVSYHIVLCRYDQRKKCASCL